MESDTSLGIYSRGDDAYRLSTVRSGMMSNDKTPIQDYSSQQPILIHMYSELPVDHQHPCDLGYHQMAWLIDGSTACGLCGMRP